MHLYEEIFANNELWIAEKLALDAQYFEKLAKGQTPEFLYIGCADSRVTAEDLMGAEPGEIFIHQANVINDYGQAVINKSSSRSIGFPWYAGPLCILTGLLLWHASKK